MSLPIQTITIIKNGKLVNTLDCNGQLLLNADPDSFPAGGGGGGGGGTGTTTAILKGDGADGFADAAANVDYTDPSGLSSALATREPLLPTPSGDNYLLTRHDNAHGATWLYTNPASIVGSNPGASTAILKGNGASGFSDAVAGTDYATPSALSSGLATKEPTLPTTTNDSYVLARHNAGGANAWFFVDPVTLGSTNATYADGATHSNTTFNSSLAGFTTNDTGKTIVCAGNIPSSTTITFVNATTVTLSNAATTTASGLTFVIINRYIAAGGGGTVTSVAATSDPTTGAGDLLSVSVNNPTTSAQLTFTKPVTTGAKTFYGNGTGSVGTAAFMNQAAAFSALDIQTAGKLVAQMANPNFDCFIKLTGNPTAFAIARTPAQVAGDIGAESVLTFNAPLNRGTGGTANQVSIFPVQVSPPRDGYLTSSDYQAFQAKVPNTRTLTTTAPLRISNPPFGQQSGVAVDLTANRVLDMPRASQTVDGYMAASDFATVLGGTPGAIVVSVSSGHAELGITSPLIQRVLFSQVTPSFILTLPPASSYGPPSFPPIEIIDVSATGAFINGATVKVVTGDSMDGITNGSFVIPRGAGYLRFSSSGAGWISTKYYVETFRKPDDATQKVAVSFDNWTTPNGAGPGTNRTLRLAPANDSVTVIPKAVQGEVLRGLDANGNLLSGTMSASEIVPLEENVLGTVDKTITNSGAITSVRLSTDLDGLRAYIFPDAHLYSAGEVVRFYDSTGSLDEATKFVRVMSSPTYNAPPGGTTGNTFNGSSFIDITEPFFGRAFVADPVLNNWTVSAGGGLNLDPWHSVTPAGGIATITCASSVIESHHIVNMNSAVTLAMAGSTPPGCTGRIKFRDSTGGHLVTVPNFTGKTPTASGTGTFTTSSGNSEDVYGWDFDGQKFNFYPLGLNMIAAAAPTFSTADVDFATAYGADTTTFAIGNSVNFNYGGAGRMLADGGVTNGSSFSIGRIKIPVYNIGSPTGFNVYVKIFDNAAGAVGAAVGTTSTGIAVSGLPTSEPAAGSGTDFNAGASLIGKRVVPSITTVSANATITGAPGSFLSSDVACVITGTGIINTALAQATILSVAADGSSAVVSGNCTASGTVSVTIRHIYWIALVNDRATFDAVNYFVWPYHTVTNGGTYFRNQNGGSTWNNLGNNHQFKYITYR